MKNFEIITNQNGRSMIEMLGVLAIIGVLSVGGIAGYSKAMMKYRVNKSVQQISLIASNIQTFFAPQVNYEGLDSRDGTGKAIIKKAKLVPDEMWDGSNIRTDFFTFNVMENYYDNGSTKEFIMYINNLSSSEACIEFLSQDWSNLTNNLIGIDMNGSSTEDEVGCTPSDHLWCVGNKDTPFPIPLDTVVKNCECWQDDSCDGIQFKFK